jgi:hypothetical protein
LNRPKTIAVIGWFLAAFLPEASARVLAQAPSEDPAVRARAVSLLERSAQLSRPVWPMNEEDFSFHIVNPEPGYPADGTLKISVAKPYLKRWEYSYGVYQFSKVENGPEIATYRTGSEPASLAMVRKMLPLSLLHFDQSDIIRAITDKNVDGTPATCIDFDTITGTRHQSGTLCVDQANGYLIYSKLDDVITKQSRFYLFNNGFLPGHIERWTNDVKLFEIESRIEVRPGGFPAEAFEYPAGATITHACNSFTPAYADNNLQPVAESFSETGIDITVRGFVDNQGHTTNLKVLDRTHPDLDAEALKLVSAWTFHPAQCNYQPTSEQRDFVVHFQGWQ